MSLNSTNISSVLPHAIDRDIAFVSIAERSPMRLAAYILSPNGNIRKGVFECPPDDGQPRPFLEGMHVVAFDMPALIEIMAMDGRVVGDVSYASVKDLARTYMPNADSRSLENLASAIGQKCEKSDPSSQARACMFAYIYLIADKGMWPSDHWIDGDFSYLTYEMVTDDEFEFLDEPEDIKTVETVEIPEPDEPAADFWTRTTEDVDLVAPDFALPEEGFADQLAESPADTFDFIDDDLIDDDLIDDDLDDISIEIEEPVVAEDQEELVVDDFDDIDWEEVESSFEEPETEIEIAEEADEVIETVPDEAFDQYSLEDLIDDDDEDEMVDASIFVGLPTSVEELEDNTEPETEFEPVPIIKQPESALPKDAMAIWEALEAEDIDIDDEEELVFESLGNEPSVSDVVAEPDFPRFPTTYNFDPYTGEPLNPETVEEPENIELPEAEEPAADFTYEMEEPVSELVDKTGYDIEEELEEPVFADDDLVLDLNPDLEEESEFEDAISIDEEPALVFEDETEEPIEQSGFVFPVAEQSEDDGNISFDFDDLVDAEDDEPVGFEPEPVFGFEPQPVQPVFEEEPVIESEPVFKEEPEEPVFTFEPEEPEYEQPVQIVEEPVFTFEPVEVEDEQEETESEVPAEPWWNVPQTPSEIAEEPCTQPVVEEEPEVIEETAFEEEPQLVEEPVAELEPKPEPEPAVTRIADPWMISIDENLLSRGMEPLSRMKDNIAAHHDMPIEVEEPEIEIAEPEIETTESMPEIESVAEPEIEIVPEPEIEPEPEIVSEPVPEPAKPATVATNSALPDFVEIGVDVDLTGAVFCLAGDFACSPKKQKPVIEYLLAHGAGKFSKDPTLECQYLIVGSNGSNLWKPGNYGSKVNKILKNIESGRATTRIIDETSVIGDDFGK